METQIGIKAGNSAEVAWSLSQLLADEFLLSTKTRRAHWNVESNDFYYMHKFFDEQYSQIDSTIDLIAERIRAVGHYTPATLGEYLALTTLSEHAAEGNDARTYLRDLLTCHESIAMNIRKNIRRFGEVLMDAGSADFLTGVLKHHEKAAWMLRAHLG